MKLLINAKIFPNNRSRSIIIKNNKIEFIGNQDDINISSKSLDIIDCKNNSVLPGLIDAHIHLFESVSNLESIDLSEKIFTNLEDIKIYFNNFAHQKNQKILKFHGFEHRNINQDINMEFFDNLNIQTPIIIKHRTGHFIFTNKNTMTSFGFSKNEIQKYSNEYPINSKEIHKKIYKLSTQDNFDQNIHLYNSILLKYGYTTLVEAGALNDIEKFETIKKYINNKSIDQNICYMPGAQEIKNFNEIKNMRNLYLGPIKFMIDEKYDINKFESILNKYLKTFNNAAAFHAIDSETIHKILFNLYEKNKDIVKDRIIRIEHATEFIPEYYKNYNKENLHLIFNPNFIYDHGDFYLNNQDYFDIENIFNLYESNKYDFNYGIGTDSPFGNNNPFLLIYAAITRNTKNGNNLPGKGQNNLKEIIKAFTINNAKSINMDKNIGSVNIGKNADLIILNKNLSNIKDYNELIEVKVIHTIINGNSKYRLN
jgi:hypothetical protein